MSKTQKVLKSGEPTKIIGNTEKKEIVPVVEQYLANLDKREKRLNEIIQKRTATIAKMQKNLDTFKSALEKCKVEKESELKAIQEFAAKHNNISKA